MQMLGKKKGPPVLVRSRHNVTPAAPLKGQPVPARRFCECCRRTDIAKESESENDLGRVSERESQRERKGEKGGTKRKREEKKISSDIST
ncbi:hypothetical protein EYC84_008216 [Monilinia fructicola]|uniref:Uncharacterized protein n=1 Tax=Monilinia fructicola TaxID=38448 RepID=A0A5M9JDR7_MONFR|nr:hypothetical protein EYC84_008216 [Monilinia fructicola]